MAEYVQKKLEDMRPILEQMRKLELFTEHETCRITKMLKEHEYKLQRHTKSKEDYLSYIQYSMDLLKLIKQRREKYQITHKKSDIDFAIANKINHLFKEAIYKFQDDVRFSLAYITFCKRMKFHSCIDRMLTKMVSVHHDKPKVWHIAARWELEEKKNSANAESFLLKGLHHHPDSSLLYIDLLKLELDLAQAQIEESNAKAKSTDLNSTDNSEVLYKKITVIYDEAFKSIKDINFIIELLNIVQEYKKSESLQKKIVSDMVQKYTNEPLMWDTMARRELKGLIQPSLNDDETFMEVDTSEPVPLRDRINNCVEVYQTAVKKIKTKDMWSLYIECMLEINQETETLPVYKRKLLRNALLSGHQAKKLKEKYYLHWINMLNVNKISPDSNTQKQLDQVLRWATEALPNSEKLWYARLQYLLSTDEKESATESFNQAITLLGTNSLSLWQLKLLDIQTKHPEKLEEFFEDTQNRDSMISNYFKPIYIEWVALAKDINEARKVYWKLCLNSSTCLELHQKMINIELLQPDISIQDIRSYYENATLHFGKENIDLWIDFIKFEMKYGDPIKVPHLDGRAVKSLKRDLVDTFVSKCSLLKIKNFERRKVSL